MMLFLHLHFGLREQMDEDFQTLTLSYLQDESRAVAQCKNQWSSAGWFVSTACNPNSNETKHVQIENLFTIPLPLEMVCRLECAACPGISFSVHLGHGGPLMGVRTLWTLSRTTGS